MKREKRILMKRRQAYSRKLHALLEAHERGDPFDVAQMNVLVAAIQQCNVEFDALDHPSHPVPTIKQRDPHLQHIEQQFLRQAISLLRCPRCGDRDHGNTMNGKPWCFVCNEPLTAITESVQNHIVKVIHNVATNVTYQPYDYAKRR